MAGFQHPPNTTTLAARYPREPPVTGIKLVEMSVFDIVAFVGFIAIVIGVSLYASRKQDTSEDYFLAGRNLSWWLIGFSLIASNISTEHFVGMTAAGYGSLGLAVASYEWIAAVCLVAIGYAFVLKPLLADE